MIIQPNNLYHGDCIEIMSHIQDNSIDMILCDLPYGVTDYYWDVIIPFDVLWEQYTRIIKDTGAIVLTANQPFSSALLMSNVELFKYEWIWVKNRVTNVLQAKKQPLRINEHILVFYKKQPTYNPQGVIVCNKQANTGFDTKLSPNKRQDAKWGVKKTETGKYTQTQTNYPKNILDFPVEPTVLHPTQKPLELGRYLIRTYTNDNDVVLDNCMGSGSFCLSALLENRRYIGIEKDDYYFNLAKQRMQETKNVTNLF